MEIKLIMLDAGHGGSDPGAINTISHDAEKTINLNVVLKLGGLLTPKYSVAYTRATDVYISPSDRLNLIHKCNPDCFISIHCNSSSNAEARGVETIYAKEKDQVLTSNIQKAMVDNLKLRDRGIKEDIEVRGIRFAVLKSETVPSCLCEIGFISSSDLYMIKNYNLVAEALMKGVDNYAAKVKNET